jgi:hypothetical protein
MVFRRRQGPRQRPLLLYRLTLIERKTLNRPSNKASVPQRFMVLAFFLVFRTLRPRALRHVLSSMTAPAQLQWLPHRWLPLRSPGWSRATPCPISDDKGQSLAFVLPSPCRFTTWRSGPLPEGCRGGAAAGLERQGVNWLLREGLQPAGRRRGETPSANLCTAPGEALKPGRRHALSFGPQRIQ